jgi:very-short-patch-repair endonuclease
MLQGKLRTIAREMRHEPTPAEALLWHKLRNRQLSGYKFHRQYSIDRFIVDFYCHELNLVIEIDGYTHDYNFVKDTLRQTRLESFGLEVVRFTDADIKKSMNDVIRSLQVIISEIENGKLKQISE